MWSPDDSAIAYTQAFESARVVRLATGADSTVPAPAPELVYSPDWRHAAAIVGTKLALVTLGGTTQTLDSAFPTPPSWSPDGRRLAFVGADESLDVIAADGSDRRVVAAHIYSYSSPSWSPDGSWLAFVEGRDIKIAPARGGAEQNLTQALPGMHIDPVWSPRGDAVAFSTDFGRRIGIVGVDASVRLDVESQLPVAYTGLALSWSPSADRLLYSERFGPTPGSPGLFAIDIATGIQQRLTQFGIDGFYSHDGSQIAFGGTVTIEPNPPQTPDCVGVGIWKVSATGGVPTLVTRTCTETPPTLSIHGPAQVDYGETTSISGALLPGLGPLVDILAQPCGRSTLSTVAVADDGAWSQSIHPTFTTSYTASAAGASVATTVRVKPVLLLRQIGKFSYALKITAPLSFAGRTAHVELRRHTGKSKLLLRLKLRSNSARFQVEPRQLHPWLESLYVALPRVATGPCLDPVVSNDLPISRP